MTELSPEARKLLQIARESFSPTDRRVAAVRSALAARLAVPHDDGGASGVSAVNGVSGVSGVGRLAGAGWWTASRLIGIGLLAAAFATGVVVLRAREIASAPRSATTPTTPTTLHPTAPARRPALALTPTDRPAAQLAQEPAREDLTTRRTQLTAHPPVDDRVDNPVHTDDRVDDRTVPRDHAQQRSSPPGSRHPASTTHARQPPVAARASQTVFASHGEHVEQSTITKISTDDEVAATPTVPVPANASTADDSLAREIALLRRARAALGQHDAQAALTLANEHADTFPSGRLRQERVAVRVLALCALGRVADARAATQELERIAPRSPHLMRIRMSCPTSDKSPAQP
jgi:hypothetical protein